MEKTLSMGAFTELDEREVMETEGGVSPVFTIRYTDSKAALKTLIATGTAAAAGAYGGGGIVGAAVWGCSAFVTGAASDVIDGDAYIMMAVGNKYVPVIF